MTYSWDLDEILQSMNLPKRTITFEELVLLSDEIEDIILARMVERCKHADK